MFKKIWPEHKKNVVQAKNNYIAEIIKGKIKQNVLESTYFRLNTLKITLITAKTNKQLRDKNTYKILGMAKSFLQKQ